MFLDALADPATLPGFLWLCAAAGWLTAAICLLPVVLAYERPRPVPRPEWG